MLLWFRENLERMGMSLHKDQEEVRSYHLKPSGWDAGAGVVTLSKAQKYDLYYDNVWDKSRAQLYEELATLAAGSGADRAAVAAKLARVEVEGQHNTGNATTNTLKLYTKWTRSRGLHVTPTVLVNGIVDDSVSSGWSLEQWTEYLDKLLE